LCLPGLAAQNFGVLPDLKEKKHPDGRWSRFLKGEFSGLCGLGERKLGFRRTEQGGGSGVVGIRAFGKTSELKARCGFVGGLAGADAIGAAATPVSHFIFLPSFGKRRLFKVLETNVCQN